MLNYDFLEKGLAIVSQPHFVHDFSRKTFLMFLSINWSNFIVGLSLLFEIWALCLLQFVSQVATS